MLGQLETGLAKKKKKILFKLRSILEIKLLHLCWFCDSIRQSYMCKVFLPWRAKEVMQETISLFKDPPVQVWELSPNTRRSDTHTHTDPHTALICLCVQVILKNMVLLWRSSRQQGTSLQIQMLHPAVQPLTEDGIPEVQISAVKAPWKVQNNAQKWRSNFKNVQKDRRQIGRPLKIQMTKMWKKTSDCNLKKMFSDCALIYSDILWVVVYSSPHSQKQVLWDSLRLPIASFLSFFFSFFNENVAVSCQTFRSQTPSQTGLSKTAEIITYVQFMRKFCPSVRNQLKCFCTKHSNKRSFLVSAAFFWPHVLGLLKRIFKPNNIKNEVFF